jgi:putative chitinase
MDKPVFFEALRARPVPLGQPGPRLKLTGEQVAGFEAVLHACTGAPLSHAAYMLATAWHETNATMQPVREAYWLSETWRKNNLRYWPWYGRGYVQLTWMDNYRRADKECAAAGLIKLGELLASPDLAMRPDIAAFIMRKGMDEGWFTGVKHASVLPPSGVATREQYMNARTIINGRDKSDLIEDYAQVFERALRNAGWLDR